MIRRAGGQEGAGGVLGAGAGGEVAEAGTGEIVGGAGVETGI